MSPLAKTRRQAGEPFRVKATRRGGVDGEVKVVPLKEEQRVRVEWLCGGSRTFTVEKLRKHIEFFDGPLGQRYRAWLNLTDSDEHQYWVHSEDSQMTANESDSANGTVGWASLKRALQAAIVEVVE